MITGSSLLQKRIAKLGALAGAIALTSLVSPAMAGEPPPPEAVQAPVSAMAATDSALRATFKEYVGLSKNQDGTVFLTFSKGAALDKAANLALEVWIANSAKDASPPNFQFTQAAASPAELKKARAAMRDVLTIKD